MNANEILAIGNDLIISKKKGNKGIYKESLFKDLSEKEKKSLRIKLRRKTNNFIGTFLQVEKKPTELKKLVGLLPPSETDRFVEAKTGAGAAFCKTLGNGRDGTIFCAAGAKLEFFFTSAKISAGVGKFAA